ncbi:hypothetical protein [Ignatzschineria sp. LJL83]
MCNKITDIVTVMTINIATDIVMNMTKNYQKDDRQCSQTLSYQGRILDFKVIFKVMI